MVSPTPTPPIEEDNHLTKIPLHVLGLVLRDLGNLPSLQAAVLAHSALHAAFVEDPSRITRDILDAQIAPDTARLAYAAHAARTLDRDCPETLRRFVDEWLRPRDVVAEAGTETGPLGVWPWGLSPGDVVAMSRMHDIVEHFSRAMVADMLPRCEGVFGRRRREEELGRGYDRATEGEARRLQHLLYGYQIYCHLLFRYREDLESLPAEDERRAWQSNVTAMLGEALYGDEDGRQTAHSQLACIHDFLENIVLEAMKPLVYNEPTWAEHKVDYLTSGASNMSAQSYLSLGLDYIYKLEQATAAVAHTAATTSIPLELTSPYCELRRLLLKHHQYCLDPEEGDRLPPQGAYMLGRHLAGFGPGAYLGASTAAARRRGLALWDEPIGPPTRQDVEMREAVLRRWDAEEAARVKEMKEVHVPAMKKAWTRIGLPMRIERGSATRSS